MSGTYHKTDSCVHLLGALRRFLETGKSVIQLREWIAGTEFFVHHPLFCKADRSEGCNPFSFRVVALALPIISKRAVVLEEHHCVAQVTTAWTTVFNPHTCLFEVMSNPMGVAHRLAGLLLPARAHDRRDFHNHKSTASLTTYRHFLPEHLRH